MGMNRKLSMKQAVLHPLYSLWKTNTIKSFLLCRMRVWTRCSGVRFPLWSFPVWQIWGWKINILGWKITFLEDKWTDPADEWILHSFICQNRRSFTMKAKALSPQKMFPVKFHRKVLFINALQWNQCKTCERWNPAYPSPQSAKYQPCKTKVKAWSLHRSFSPKIGLIRRWNQVDCMIKSSWLCRLINLASQRRCGIPVAQPFAFRFQIWHVDLNIERSLRKSIRRRDCRTCRRNADSLTTGNVR